ncbi:MAG: hypothetical protein IPM39_19950 [Chloroflexi bacterium]|nr:hypothetical protein [Chloroflexota bacterium]
MRSFQRLKSRFIKTLLNHRWLIVLLLGASALLFEVIEHWGEPNPVDAHFVREILFYGVAFPVAVGLLLNLLLQTQDQRNMTLRQQAWEKKIQQELHRAANWDELLRVIVSFPELIAPIVGAALFYYDPADEVLKHVAEFWLSDEEGGVLGETAVSPTICGLKHHPPEQGLHPFLSTPHPDAALRGYCLPLWSNDRFIGLLQIYLPATEQLNVEQISIFNHLVAALAISLETSALDRPEFLRAQAARQERERVARRLHDTLGQNLSYLRLKLDQLTVEETLRHDPAVHQDIERMRDVANEAYEQVRYTMLTLQPDSTPDLTEELLLQTRLMAERIGAGFHHQLQGKAAPIPPLAQHKILFIFREALTNVQGHAQAANIEMTIIWTPHDLMVCLTDDGVGFDPDKPAAYGPVGLLVMRQRAEEIKGQLSIRSQPGQGTQVRLHYPFGDS